MLAKVSGPLPKSENQFGAAARNSATRTWMAAAHKTLILLARTHRAGVQA